MEDNQRVNVKEKVVKTRGKESEMAHDAGTKEETEGSWEAEEVR